MDKKTKSLFVDHVRRTRWSHEYDSTKTGKGKADHTKGRSSEKTNPPKDYLNKNPASCGVFMWKNYLVENGRVENEPVPRGKVRLILTEINS